MTDGFLKFKRKIQLEALLKSIIIGLSISLIAVGTLLLIMKLNGIVLAIYIYILLGILLLALGIVASYLILRPKDMKVAMRLDNELKLNEKCKTMISFENEPGFMLDIQRDDTNKLLEATPAKSLRLRFHFVYFIALAIALGISITSFAIPTIAKEGKDEVVDKDFVEDDYILQSIRDLIRYVEESNAQPAYKEKTINGLEEIYNLAKDPSTKEGIMLKSVESLIEVMEATVMETDASQALFNLFKNDKDKLVREFAIQVSVNDKLQLSILFDRIRDGLIPEDDKQYESVAELAKVFAVAFSENLADYKNNGLEAFKDYELFKALNEYGLSMNDIWSDNKNHNFKNEKELKNILTPFEGRILASLDVQKETYLVNEYVTDALINLFSLVNLEDPENTETTRPSHDEDLETNTNTESNNGGGAGGLGDGEVIYGSDDRIYDPVLNKFLRYGDVIDAYKAVIDKDIEDGILTDEMINFYREYYKKLMTKDEGEQ